jgi:hypothetical protein
MLEYAQHNGNINSLRLRRPKAHDLELVMAVTYRNSSLAGR